MKILTKDIADFHSHILPCADHGSDSPLTTSKQIKLASGHGVSRILATPHFYPHCHIIDSYQEKIQASVSLLRDKVEKTGVEIKLGYEVLLCEGIENFKNLDSLTFSGTNYIMLELPFSEFREDFCKSAARLKSLGLEVILAHVDRYPAERIDAMLDYGINKFQINAAAFKGIFNNKRIIEYAKCGYIVALGSDIHGTDAAYYNNFNKAKSKLLPYLDVVKKSSDDIWNKISPI